MRKSAAVAIILAGALLGAAFSMIVVGSWANERKYVYSSPIDYALDYLSDEPYKNLAIEVDWVAGCEPDRSALNFLVEKIKEYCDKDSVYIDWNASDEIMPHTNIYTFSEIENLENEYRDLYKHGDTAVIYYIYLNGKFQNSAVYEDVYTEVVGMTYTHSSVAIFKDEIRSVADVGLNVHYTERSILLHEFGHLICLVGIGYHSDQEDPEHPHHTIHKDGVMYYAINATEGAGIPPQDFCNDSKQEMEWLKSRPRDVSNARYIPWLLLLADIIAASGLIITVLTRKEEKAPPYYPYYPEYNQQEYPPPYQNYPAYNNPQYGEQGWNEENDEERYY